MPKIIGTPTPRFNLNNVVDGEGYVIMVFRYAGKVLRYNPGAKVKAKYWDKKGMRAKFTGNHPEYVEVNRLINEINDTVLEIYQETKGDIDPETMRKEILYRTGQKERPQDAPIQIPTLPEFAALFVEERKTAIAGKRGTWKILQTVANYLEAFSDETGKPWTFEQIDHNFAHLFTNWLFSRNFSTNYASKIFSVVRQFMHEAKRRKLHHNDSFTDFSIKTEKSTKIALTFDELELLYDLELTDNRRLERVRDLFLIGCYTGLRYSDFSRIEPGHVVDVDGEMMLEITTQKTGDCVTIPFMPELEKLLSKYDYNPPRISGQKMNDYLKEVGQLANLSEKIRVVTHKGGKKQETSVEKWQLITTHVARRSFATNLYLLGIPAVNIMKITGHATEKQFMSYICIEGRMNAQHMSKQIAMKRGKPYLRKVE